MANVNRVFLGGNLTKDPILSNLPGGTAVVDFRIATNRVFTDKDGQKREETCYIDCNAFGSKATNIHKYFNKGRPIFIEGRLKLDTWETPEGAKRSKIKIVAENFHFVDYKKDNEEIVDPVAVVQSQSNVYDCIEE